MPLSDRKNGPLINQPNPDISVKPTRFCLNLTMPLEGFSHLLQKNLFERLETEVGPLGSKARLLVSVLSAISLSRWIAPARGWRGRPAQDRVTLAAAFVAKAVYGLETTRQLCERVRSDAQLRCLCGWNRASRIPHESTFSRAFAEFASSEMMQHIHQALIEQTQRNRLIGHIARDSTAIEARERFPESYTPRRKPKPRRPKRSRPEARRSRIQQQGQQSQAEQLQGLSRHCSLGVKKSSQGHRRYWRGYKLHLDVADGQIPITALLTGACVHDSQVAIPLMTRSSERVTYLYDLMDAAYDAQAIRQQSVALGHRPIIDPAKRYRTLKTRLPLRKNSRSWRMLTEKEEIPRELTWAERERFTERTMVERVYSRLKDEFGARFIRVRGASKVMAHLMFGILALTVDQLLKLSG